ncbi:DUF2934 domain-containing protein [Neorhizobium sp. LjRoot104]|uniref:DUF2934 domain-containing protein n=1 Tax=Neorhizobium sp. LjRoot104 TaxID=3342254 RepID=UPI003ECF4E83
MQGQDDAVRLRAYQIWESEGRPEGRDGDHWRRAEEQLGVNSSSLAPAVFSSSDTAAQGLEADPEVFQQPEEHPDIEVSRTDAFTSVREKNV